MTEQQPPSAARPRRRGLLGWCRRNKNDNDDEEEEEIVPMKWPSESPEQDASLVSKLLYWWIQPLFSRASYLRAHNRGLQQSDLAPLADMDHGAVVSSKFEETWHTLEQQQQHDTKQQLDSDQHAAQLEKRLVKSLLSVIGRRIAVAGVVKFFNTALQFSFPLLLNAILQYIEKMARGGEEVRFVNGGYALAVALLLAMACKAVTEGAYFHLVNRAGFQCKAAVSAAVYQKSLRLAASERGTTTLGEMVNLLQIDAEKMEQFIPQINVLWDGLFQIIGYMAILYTLIGWPCFVGLAVMMVAGPIQGTIMKRLFGLNRQMVKYTDERVKTTNEALQGIRCVKMYTWESSFEQTINESRTQELSFLKRIAILRGFSRAYMGALPGIVAVVSFIVYAKGTGGTPEASTLFAALVAFEQLRFPLLFYPMALALYAQAKVSAGRVSAFLGLGEIQVSDGRYTREKDDDCEKKDIEEETNEVDEQEGDKVEKAIEKESNGIVDDTITHEKSHGEIIMDNVDIYWSDPTIPLPDDFDDKSINSTKSYSDTSTEDASEAATVKYPKPVLRHVSLRVSQGELCATVGRVGSGKSTLCSAILNETVLGEGHITVKGSVAYAAQSPWILNGTLRDNILFGLPMDQDRYDAVLSACQLTHDLSLLDNGDMTEIGERGINLSGGQKQRISVARVAYADADTIILDDPLSALDPEVGLRLFDQCILGLMKGKTRLLVTNQLQCLKHCDTVVSLGKGRVIEKGTYQDLMAAKHGEVRRLLQELKDTEPEKAEKTQTIAPAPESEPDLDTTEHGLLEEKKEEIEEKEGGGLTSEEERNVGAVKFSMYLKYLKAGGGYCRFSVVFSTFILSTAVSLLTNVWVSIWSSDPLYVNFTIDFYLGIYAAIAVSLGIVTFFRSFLLANFGVTASTNLHQNLLASVLRAPMYWFDTTPTGRILSRFSKDMFSIDTELSEMLDFFLFGLLTVLVSLGTIAYATPWFALAVLPVLWVYFKVLNYFRQVSRETKRLDSISRSPVYSQFSETLGGLSTIRAYGQTARFVNEFLGRLDQNTRAYYNNKTADRWLSVRLELIGALIAGMAAVFAARVAVSGSDNGSFASIAGLSLTYAISTTSVLQWVVRTFAQLESAMNACERVVYYTDNIPHEAPATADALEKHANSTDPEPDDPSAFAVMAEGGKAIHSSTEWPPKGNINLDNLVMRYREGTPVVLKGLNVSIGGGERVGVVGRTGSGKSSLLLSLMRIVEPELTGDESQYRAPISIDGVDVLRIGLDDLRTKLGIIPQNPVLFSGTVRMNIDPFNEFSDDQIWLALAKCGMKEAVETMPGELSGMVAEYGENLSQGQRQLLCLGRALLKQCRVLLLDEATSSVDFETDREIQRTLRDSFAGSTVLTIAHRINTIMDSDKILVMKDGKAAEFASPKELLSNEESLFSDIVRHSKSEGNTN